MMYELFMKIHYVVSSMFILIALIVVSWSLLGWVRNLKRNPVFDRLSYFFIHVLYIQTITGILLYFFLIPDTSLSAESLEHAMEQSSLRFWAIEHVGMMLFALMLAQIGRLYLKQVNSDKKLYRSSFLYFGTSFIIVIFSVGIAIIK